MISQVSLGSASNLRVQAVDTALDLCASSTQLEAYLALTYGLLHLCNAAAADILQRMLDAGVEVWQELSHRALVLYVARNTLRNLDDARFAEVPCRCCIRVIGLLGSMWRLRRARNGRRWRGLALLHRFDAAHTAIRFHALAVMVEVLAWSF